MKQKKLRQLVIEEFVLPFGDKFKQSWAEWMEYRAQRKLARYTPIGFKKTMTMIVNISNNDEDTAVQIIDNSISNNYQGLFRVKTQQNAQPSTTSRTKQVSDW